MSTAVISYSSLKSAAGAAGTTARRMDSYASEIKSTLVRQLGSYDGPKGGNVNEAVSELNRKVSELETRADSYKNYETNLKSVHDACVDTDKRVKSRVSSLTASFKNSHGISNSRIVNGISYVLTSLANVTGIGRFFNDVNDWIGNQWDYLKGCIKDWYQYDGGKYLIGDSILAVCTAALAIIGAVAAVAAAIGAVTIGPIVVAVAAVFLAITAAVGAVVNIVNNKKAYDAAQNGDPATAKRWDQVDTIQDALRKTDSKFAHLAAGVLDVCELVANVVTLVATVGTLLKKGYNWIGKRRFITENFKWSQHASWAEFKSGISRITTNYVQKGKKLVQNIKSNRWDKVGVTMKNLLSWEAGNIKASYIKKLDDIKGFGQGFDKTVKSLNTSISLFKKTFTILDKSWQGDEKGVRDNIYKWVQGDILSNFKTKTFAHRNDFSLGDIVGVCKSAKEIVNSDGMKQLLNFNMDSLKFDTKNYKDIIFQLKGGTSYQYNYNNVNYGF